MGKNKGLVHLTKQAKGNHEGLTLLLGAISLFILIASVALLCTHLHLERTSTEKKRHLLSEITALLIAKPLSSSNHQSVRDAAYEALSQGSIHQFCIYNNSGQLIESKAPYSSDCLNTLEPKKIFDNEQWHFQNIHLGSIQLGTLALKWDQTDSKKNDLLILMITIICLAIFLMGLSFLLRKQQPRNLQTLDTQTIDRIKQGSHKQISATINAMAPLRPPPAIKQLLQVLAQRIYTLDKKNEALKSVAFNDPLTGLPNRRYYLEHLKTSLLRLKRTQKPFALMLIDLNDFKKVNDTLGHETGDQLLTQVSQILRQAVRGDDFVSRLGGDEFTIILQDCDNHIIAQRIAQSIIQSLSHPIQTPRSSVSIGASIGISIAPGDSDDPQELTRQADQAMYNAKRRGKNQVIFWNNCLNNRSEPFNQEEIQLLQALESQSLELSIIPQVSFTRPSQILGGSVHPSLKKIGPQEQTLSSETIEQIIDQTCNPRLLMHYYKWILKETGQLISLCEFHSKVQHPPPFTVALSPHKLQLACFLHAFKTTLRNRQIKPSQIIIQLHSNSLERLYHLPIGFIESFENLELIDQLNLSLEINPPLDAYTLLNKLPHKLITRVQVSANDYLSMSESGSNECPLQTIAGVAKRFDCELFITQIDSHLMWQKCIAKGATGAQGGFCAKGITPTEFFERINPDLQAQRYPNQKQAEPSYS